MVSNLAKVISGLLAFESLLQIYIQNYSDEQIMSLYQSIIMNLQDPLPRFSTANGIYAQKRPKSWYDNDCIKTKKVILNILPLPGKFFWMFLY